jgi:poly-beta-1,6-N-acetyl-D-glucosamine biosynthesis protein PgaD
VKPPTAPFEAPLILDAASRPRLSRIGDAVVTLLLWMGWFYLLLAAIGSLWIPPFVHRLLPVEPPDNPWTVIRIALINAAIAALVCVVMYGRVLREKRLFAGDDRRLGFAPPTDEQIAAALRAPLADLPAWRSARRLVVHHDDTGAIIGAEIGN